MHRGEFLYAADYFSGVFTTPFPQLTLSPPVTPPAQGIELELSAQWAPAVPELRGACKVSAGSCTLTSFDAAAGTANVRWTLPGSAGPATLEFAVGDWQRFVRARHRLIVP